MKLDPKTAFALASAKEIPTDPLFAFVTLNHARLWEGVRFLAGYEASRVVDRCVALLEHNGRVTPRTRLMIDQIHSVLSLDQVDNPELPFMGYFAAIDPSDPVVAEICLLCDGLGAAIENSARCERGAGTSRNDRTA